MPGKVVSFAVKAGGIVTKGQALVMRASMKMEYTIAVPAARYGGRVAVCAG
jgi:3-methylcrotonyl-CoA carboxylase alpha subunit